jgi:hypothetical protein
MAAHLIIGTSEQQRPRAGGHGGALARWPLGVRRLGHCVGFVDRSLEAGSLHGYRSYIRSSRAEFSVAQSMYVATRAFAEQCFDARKVLGRLLDRLGVGIEARA